MPGGTGGLGQGWTARPGGARFPLWRDVDAPAADISGVLAAESLTEPNAPMRHTVMVLDAGSRHFVLRQGIEGNRQFFIVSSISGK